MAEELSYKRLRDMAREEKAAPALSRIPDDFYPSIEAFLSSKFSEMETNRSVLQMREFENATAVIREIAQIRQQKILFKAIRSRGEHGKTDGMTREEHGIYDRFCGILEEENGRLSSVLARFESRKEAQKQAAEPSEKTVADETGGKGKFKRLRFIRDIQAYIGMDRQTIGPFKPGEEGTLPDEEAKLLLKEKMAEEIA